VALGVDREHDGSDATSPTSPLVARPGEPVDVAAVRTGPRVGVAGDGAGHAWRFWLDGESTVSAYRPAVSRRRRAPGSGRLGA
jgi:DNA-3-methyladenine glycosylase